MFMFYNFYKSGENPDDRYDQIIRKLDDRNRKNK